MEDGPGDIRMREYVVLESQRKGRATRAQSRFPRFWDTRASSAVGSQARLCVGHRSSCLRYTPSAVTERPASIRGGRARVCVSACVPVEGRGDLLTPRRGTARLDEEFALREYARHTHLHTRVYVHTEISVRPFLMRSSITNHFSERMPHHRQSTGA